MTGPAAERTRARKGDGERLRVEILDAAEKLLVQKGDADAVSVRAIARAVGVTPPSLYLHFADKDELLFHVCSRRFEEFDEVLGAAADGATSHADALLQMGAAYVAHGLANPEAYLVLFGVKGDLVPDDIPEEELPGMQAFYRLVGIIDEGAKAGEFTVVDPVASAIGVWSTMHGLVMLLMHNDDGHLPIPDDIVALVGRQALQGLLAR